MALLWLEYERFEEACEMELGTGDSVFRDITKCLDFEKYINL